MSEEVKPKRNRVYTRSQVHSEEIDNKIKAWYAKRFRHGRQSVPTIEKFGEQIGWPAFAVRRRAKELGLSKSMAAWTDKEHDLLCTYIHKTVIGLQAILKRNGFHRSRLAIISRITLFNLHEVKDHYTALSLSRLMGVQAFTVQRWIGCGWLEADRRGTGRTAAQGGDEYAISPGQLRTFLLKHPTRYDFKKILDQVWFLDIIAEGCIGERFVTPRKSSVFPSQRAE